MTETAPGAAQWPVLYSFRRCPYAIRARLALAASGSTVEVREVVLRDKPQAMLDASPKGSVPVMVLPDGEVLDQSLAIMRWALQRRDPVAWLAGDAAADASLIDQNDAVFKAQLDRYKYFVRYPEHTQSEHRAQAESSLRDWEQRLLNNGGSLIDARPRLADAALFPFVRQFAAVEPQWWATAPYPRLRLWLQTWAASSLLASVMAPLPAWKPGAEPTVIAWSQPARDGLDPISSARAPAPSAS
jgi:glutathione S-transferase